MTSGISLSDMTKPPKKDVSNITVDEAVTKEFATCDPLCPATLNESRFNAILASVGKGVSLNTASLAAGVPPLALKRILAKGREDYESVAASVEDIEDFNSRLTTEAKFFIGLCEAKGNTIVTMHNILYDRAEELPWVAQWFLNVLEPETYNLKYKMHKEDREDSQAGVNANITFEFKDGMKSRPPEEAKSITDAVNALHEQYKAHDIVDTTESENNDGE